MNTLCVDQFSEIGGAQRCLLDLLPSFAERGWQTRVVVPGDGSMREAVHKMGFQTHMLSYRSYTKIRKPPHEIVQYMWELPKLVSAIQNLLRAQSTDLIYVNGPRVLPPCAWVARRKSIPLVFHCHSRLHQTAAILGAGKSLRLGRARVIGCCRYATEPITPYVRRERLRIIYNGADPPCPTPQHRVKKLRRIGVIGRIEPEKGQLEFVRAAHAVVQFVPDARFFVVGAPLFSDGSYMRRVIEAASGLPIEFCGWKQDLSSVFASLDLVVVPSTCLDATPRVLMEALAAGLPVLAFPTGGIPEVIRDMETGFLAAHNTPAALARRIVDVLTMPESRVSAIKASAQAEWQRSYSLDQYRRNVCDFVHHAVSPYQSGPDELSGR